MHAKKVSRIRRATRSRAKIKELAVYRLSVHRTPRHIYAQVIAPNGSEVVASVSTVQADIKGGLKATLKQPHRLARRLRKRPSLPVSPRWHLTAPVLNTMVVSKHWQMLPVKMVWNSKG